MPKSKRRVPSALGSAHHPGLSALLFFFTLSTFPVSADEVCFPDLRKDKKGFLDLPRGYVYDELIKSGSPMTDGRSYPFRPDLIVYMTLPDKRDYLIISHELAADWRPEWGAGALTKHRLNGFKIEDSRILAEGMRFNCSGCATPWASVLTNEEYPWEFRVKVASIPDHGYIWEVDPVSGNKVKRGRMGRFSHEESEFLSDGSVLMTEDAPGAFLYRFFPSKKGDLSQGRLTALNAKEKKWVTLNDVTLAHREAKKKGATPFNRLEGLTISSDGMLAYVAENGDLESQPPDRNGRILLFNTRDWSSRTLYEGSPNEIMNPDNLHLDRKGNLWIMEGQFKSNLKANGSNEIWVRQASGKLCLFAKLWDDTCEPTGPEFSPDGKALFINFQCDAYVDRTLAIHRPDGGVLGP